METRALFGFLLSRRKTIADFLPLSPAAWDELVHSAKIEGVAPLLYTIFEE